MKSNRMSLEHRLRNLELRAKAQGNKFKYVGVLKTTDGKYLTVWEEVPAIINSLEEVEALFKKFNLMICVDIGLAELHESEKFVVADTYQGGKLIKPSEQDMLERQTFVDHIKTLDTEPKSHFFSRNKQGQLVTLDKEQPIIFETDQEHIEYLESLNELWQEALYPERRPLIEKDHYCKEAYKTNSIYYKDWVTNRKEEIGNE